MSRIELGGWGPPIPLPEDGLELAEDDENRLPLVYNLPDGTIFKPGDYMAFGYTHYEVVVIGAGGGEGGAVSNLSYGGAGGGGGLHVVHGRLDELPEEVLVTVGQAGADGEGSNNASRYVVAQESFLTDGNHLAVTQKNPPYSPYYDVDAIANFPYHLDGDGIGGHGSYVLLPNVPLAEAQTWGVFIVPEAFQNPYVEPEDGEDGEASKFGEVAMASGGKGGKKAPYYRDVPWNSGDMHRPGGDGGDGGTGGTDVAGGGGSGAIAGPSPWPPRITQEQEELWLAREAQIGSWDGTIGEGGGGGRGGSLEEGF